MNNRKESRPNQEQLAQVAKEGLRSALHGTHQAMQAIDSDSAGSLPRINSYIDLVNLAGTSPDVPLNGNASDYQAGRKLTGWLAGKFGNRVLLEGEQVVTGAEYAEYQRLKQIRDEEEKRLEEEKLIQKAYKKRMQERASVYASGAFKGKPWTIEQVVSGATTIQHIAERNFRVVNEGNMRFLIPEEVATVNPNGKT